MEFPHLSTVSKLPASLCNKLICSTASVNKDLKRHRWKLKPGMCPDTLSSPSDVCFLGGRPLEAHPSSDLHVASYLRI